VGRALVSGKEHCPKALTAERSSGNMPGKPAFFRYQARGMSDPVARLRNETAGVSIAYVICSTVRVI
jgi:hypothetical protein